MKKTDCWEKHGIDAETSFQGQTEISLKKRFSGNSKFLRLINIVFSLSWSSPTWAFNGKWGVLFT